MSARSKWAIAAAAIASAYTLAHCASNLPPTGDVTGTVIDVSTNQPVEGAYVMAVYRKAGSQLFAHSASWCFKTQGMYTGKNGVFRFPEEDSHRPEAYVIKPDFTRTSGRRAAVMERMWDGSQRIKPDPNLYLKPQDPADPSYVGYETCERAETREDVEANIVFLKFRHAEMQKYFPGRQSEADFQRIIAILESLPAKAPGAKK